MLTSVLKVIFSKVKGRDHSKKTEMCVKKRGGGKEKERERVEREGRAHKEDTENELVDYCE